MRAAAGARHVDGYDAEGVRYWSDVLPAIAHQPGETLVVRYDPRDQSRLYVMGSDRHERHRQMVATMTLDH
jgi:hypothetical protein